MRLALPPEREGGGEVVEEEGGGEVCICGREAVDCVWHRHLRGKAGEK